MALLVVLSLTSACDSSSVGGRSDGQAPWDGATDPDGAPGDADTDADVGEDAQVTEEDCPLYRLLEPDDVPCPCGGVTIDASMIAGECYCQPLGLVCHDPTNCAETQVADATDLWDHLTGFGTYGPYTSEVWPISVDLVAATPLTIHADDFCAAHPACVPDLSFIFWNHPPGVTLEGEHPFVPGFRTTLVLEAGARFRIRSMSMDIHPLWLNFAPVAQILDPCTTPCDSGNARCFEDQVCYYAGQSFCDHCLALGAETCACHAADGLASDGDSCWFMVSGDVMYEGVCGQGICQ